MHQAPQARPSAEPITGVIADRVRQLRENRGMNQSDLAAAMAARGVPWKRATVVNLEKRAADSRGAGGGRDAVTTQELLTLALVLDVPPVMLLADPRHTAEVPVGDVLAPAWDALGWLVGANTLDPAGRTAPEFMDAAARVDYAILLGEAIRALRQAQLVTGTRDPETDELTRDPGRVREITEERERRALESIRQVLRRIARSGGPLPVLPADVTDRAAELGADMSVEG